MSGINNICSSTNCSEANNIGDLNSSIAQRKPIVTKSLLNMNKEFSINRNSSNTKRSIATTSHQSTTNDISLSPDQTKIFTATVSENSIPQETLNKDLVKTLNKVTDSFKYKTTLRSSKRRQMILNALNQETEKTITNETLKAIVDAPKCSRGVKTALLLSDKVSLAQKQEILKNSSGEILAYAKDHKILDQVAYCAVGGMQGTSMQKTEALMSAIFNKDGNFDISHCPEGLKAFFNPSTFTTEERATIVKQLETKKTQNPQTDDAKINNLKIDLMIAQFQQDDEAMINATFGVVNEVFNFVNNKIFAENFKPLEPLQESQLSKLKDQTQSILDIQNAFHKNLKSPQNDQQVKYNNCYNMLCGQLLSKENLIIRDLITYIQKNNEQQTNSLLEELKNWNATLTNKQTMLNMFSKDNYENTLNKEKLYQLKLGAESSFNGIDWINFDTNCKNGINSFNLNTFITRYTDEQEQTDRKDLQNWLDANNIQIKVENYPLDKMDNLISDLEKAVEGRTDLKPYTSQ